MVWIKNITMKELFESRFPFVKQSDEVLTEEELSIKREYEKTYNGIGGVVCIPCEEKKADRLREVHVNETGAGIGSKRRRNGDSDSKGVLPN